jgi:hypothetical protein
MFTVDYQKEGKILSQVPMLGANLADVLNAALETVSRITLETGVRPDVIRIADMSNNQVTLHKVPEPHYFTFREWKDATVDKIVTLGLYHTPEAHRDRYIRTQIESAIRQALRHGRSGRGEDDPVER